jgi:hypothetical protein
VTSPLPQPARDLRPDPSPESQERGVKSLHLIQDYSGSDKLLNSQSRRLNEAK